MAESSENSAKSDKRSTKRANITVSESLEILQQSVIYCQKAGITARVMPIEKDGHHRVAIILDDVQVIDGNLIAINGNPGDGE